ncbi:DUF5633 domain-containing protein [Anaerococcus porci]|uniref:Uncharacterized protein n=1 Tax=Anaerococcus porci TaxID=2652269 RepID=A0A6N7VUU7_9FIRM|nr:DUF5633 domain-containing protein [Anaerococcus porci]MDY3005528.1 DUF5633 domain-containing protein [Anaerococcus porci]MSS78626.1 hypothetical protein [Anaerococcus porci]
MGFATKKEAENAAKKVLENDEINKSYSISKEKDGKYYVALSPVEAVEEDKENKEKYHSKDTKIVQKTEDDHNKDDKKVRRVENENEVKKVNNPTNRSNNVRTGVGSIAGIGGMLGLSLAEFLATKKKNK